MLTRDDCIRQDIAIRTRAIGDSGFASESWWLDCTREEFAARVRANQARLASSRFGQATMLATGSYDQPLKPVAPEKVPRERGVRAAQ